MHRSLLIAPAIVWVSALCSSSLNASIISNVWSTGITAPGDGAFGTSGSVSGNSLSAEIMTGSLTATIDLTASNGNWHKLVSSSPTETNNQLAPFFENNVPVTELAFSSDMPLANFDIILHNVWNATDNSIPGGERRNYIGNFRVTYEDGTVINNALPTVRSINDDSPFETDFLGGTLQPSDLPDVFDGGNKLVVSENGFDPGNGAAPGYYWSDPSRSLMSETQGFAIFSFDESIGSITDVDFTWVGNTIETSTAFIGFAGTVVPTTVPEPVGWLIPLTLAIYCQRFRRV